MSLPSPNLDDRDFRQLLEEAIGRIRATCPEWTDFTPGNPGMVLLELYAHLTEVMIYRLNRVPEKLYIEFLRLLGVTLNPPAAARTELRFRLPSPGGGRIEIPRGTVVSAAGAASGTVQFVTHRYAEIPAGETEIHTLAYHANWIQAEPLGRTSGLPGETYQVKRPPIVAGVGDGQDLVVGVELRGEEVQQYVEVATHEGRAYGIWREVDDFLEAPVDEPVYVADRNAGTIRFAPWGRGEIRDPDSGSPPAGENPDSRVSGLISPGREVRVWYYRGGGREGNIADNQLTSLVGPLSDLGLAVTNPRAAAGGRDAESIEHAIRRGPMELHALNRAVTATDFELLALRTSGALARARAITLKEIWSFAVPGTVQLLLVPALPDADRPSDRPIPADAFLRQHEAVNRSAIQAAIDRRKPLGTRCEIAWAQFKTVRVKARVVVSQAERQEDVRKRVMRRLYQTICPLPNDAGSGGWPFGQSLHASGVYQAILSEPSVRYADQVRLIVDEVPRDIQALAVDPNQPRTVYAAGGTSLYRSTNGGDGWERIHQLPYAIRALCPHPDVPGLLAIVSGQEDGESNWEIHLSPDCVESLERRERFDFRVHDLAWTLRGGEPVALLATARGLYEMVLAPGRTPVQIVVDPTRQDQGFAHVEVAQGRMGKTIVAVAASTATGIWLSEEGGAASSFFRVADVGGSPVASMAVQYRGPRVFLWVGIGALADEGAGAARLELREGAVESEGWTQYSTNWEGGSCNGLAVSSTGEVLAATHHSGVLIIDPSREEPKWRVPNKKTCNLPERVQDPRFPLEPVSALGLEREADARPHESEDRGQHVFAGTPEGVFRTVKGRYPTAFAQLSVKEFSDEVTLPATWLFQSGEHEVEIRVAGEKVSD
jgi:hypothetical protein